MAPRYYISDYDELFRYIGSDGHSHDVPLRDLTVEELLAVVNYYKLKREAPWNESTLTERLSAAMLWVTRQDVHVGGALRSPAQRAR